MKMENEVQKKRCLYICNISPDSDSTSLLPCLITPYHTIRHTDTCLYFCSVPAMITSHPNTTMARKGQTKELNCTARGEQPIIIRWERGDTVIDAERNPRYSITINKKGDEVISTLKVRYRIQQPANSEMFKYRVKNDVMLFDKQPQLVTLHYISFTVFCGTW